MKETPRSLALWPGLGQDGKAAEYVDIVESTGMSWYRETPGNQGTQPLTRDLGEGTEPRSSR